MLIGISWRPLVSADVHVSNTDAFVLMPWWIFKRVSSEQGFIPITWCTLTHCRQINMDYALSHALHHNMASIQWVVTFYDVNYQYMKNLHNWLSENAYISLPPQFELVPAISAWHIHGHQQACLAQYGANFIPCAGCVDGEIMETLWAWLNVISPSARVMSATHWQELLNYQMSDSNFLKMVHMSKSNNETHCLAWRECFQAGLSGGSSTLPHAHSLKPTQCLSTSMKTYLVITGQPGTFLKGIPWISMQRIRQQWTLMKFKWKEVCNITYITGHQFTQLQCQQWRELNWSSFPVMERRIGGCMAPSAGLLMDFTLRKHKSPL